MNNLVSLGKGFIAPSFDVHKFPIIDAFFENKEMKHLYTVDRGGNLFVWSWTEDKSEAYVKRMETIKRRLDQRRGVASDNIKK